MLKGDYTAQYREFLRVHGGRLAKFYPSLKYEYSLDHSKNSVPVLPTVF